jgi:hypothetical protein
LFAKIRWSDVGEEAVKGGRYRFLSPVWNRADCVDLGGGRVRPVRLLNAAVTNDPNLKGMVPLSNRGQRSEVGDHRGESTNRQGAEVAKENGPVANAAGADPRFKWVVGDTPKGRHCPSCAAVAGQVHTMAEWDAAGVKPGAEGLLCQGNCQCQLVPTDEAASGSLADVPLRNRAVIGGTERKKTQNVKALANTGWTDEARVASLAVRQAKAGVRGDRNERARDQQAQSMDRASRDYAKIYEEKGLKGMTAEEVSYLAARISVKVRNGTQLTDTEARFVKEHSAASPVLNRSRSLSGGDVRSIVRAAVWAVRKARDAKRVVGG